MGLEEEGGRKIRSGGRSFCWVDFGRLAAARQVGVVWPIERYFQREVFEAVTERERVGNQEEKKKKENQRKDSREISGG